MRWRLRRAENIYTSNRIRLSKVMTSQSKPMARDSPVLFPKAPEAGPLRHQEFKAHRNAMLKGKTTIGGRSSCCIETSPYPLYAGPFCRLPPGRGLAFTLGAVPLMSGTPATSSISVLTPEGLRRLCGTLGLVLALVPWLPVPTLVLVPC